MSGLHSANRKEGRQALMQATAPGLAPHVSKRAAKALARVREFSPSEGPARRVEMPGRNDACPCGSGKKFKRCCLK